MKREKYLSFICEKLDNFNFDQLNILFHVCFQLNCFCDYFMTEQTHMKFIDHYYSTPNIRNFETFKTFMMYSIINFFIPSKLSDLLNVINMIEERHPYEKIINTFCPLDKVSNL